MAVQLTVALKNQSILPLFPGASHCEAPLEGERVPQLRDEVPGDRRGRLQEEWYGDAWGGERAQVHREGDVPHTRPAAFARAQELRKTQGNIELLQKTI